MWLELQLQVGNTRIAAPALDESRWVSGSSREWQYEADQKWARRNPGTSNRHLEASFVCDSSRCARKEDRIVELYVHSGDCAGPGICALSALSAGPIRLEQTEWSISNATRLRKKNFRLESPEACAGREPEGSNSGIEVKDWMAACVFIRVTDEGLQVSLSR